MSGVGGLATHLERALERLPHDYPGPGGAAAVLKDGEVVIRHAWGYANAEQRIAFTPKTLFRICSITKQFTCALALDAFPDLDTLDADVAARLPRLDQAPPGAGLLAHNQSGLRDYWAVAMLHGAPAELPFGDREARRVIAGARTLQFAPGTRYSYANQNYRILGDAVSERLGMGLGELLRKRIFGPAGMETAFLAADTRALPDGTEGYEGDVASGFRPARNNLIWTGDAGIAASLDDMIAWEKQADEGRDDPASVYGRLSAPVAFADGAPAAYGYGLSRGLKFGRSITGHGGALRGWRSHRLYCPSDRISVVVMFNHLGEAGAAASDLLCAALGGEDAKPSDTVLPEGLTGAWIEPETGIIARIARSSDRAVAFRYSQHAEALAAQSDGSASDGETNLVWTALGIRLSRARDNQTSLLTPLATTPRLAGIAGRYRCEELDAELTVADAGGAFYGAFSGFLGEGRMERLEPVGAAVWALPCPRALDHTPPGDWTLAFTRDESGAVSSVRVGCWLARNLIYDRV